MRPSDKRRTRARTARLETFEPRELLSAVPVYDFWLDDQQHPETGLYADLNPAMTNAHALTGLDQARAAYGFTGAGQTVAVIDTGIAYSHYALGGGYGPGYRVVGGWDFTKASSNAFDNGPYGSHGTHVAGIIGSSDSVYTGVAPEVDLVALRVFDDNGGGYFSWVEQALWWVHENRFAFENPITAVNLSLGASYNAASLPSWAMLETALAQLKADGIFVAVAAGNSFAQYNAPGLSYPAVSPRVVAVGSVAGNGLLSSFSQRHTSMIAAPGQSIMSTVPDYVGNYNGVHDDFARYSGTSMATPYVAGASVLLREAYAFAGIANVNQAALYNAMYTTADTFFDAATQQTYRRLNLQAAIDTIMPADDYGSTAATAHAMGTLASDLSLTGHISRLDDVDWFQFTAGAAGTVTVTVNPTLSLAPKWSINGFAVSAGNGGRSITFDVVAGQTYRFGLATSDGLGHYSLSAGLNGGANPGTLLDVLVADFTGNGMDDIVGRSAHDGTWWMAVNHGNGVFTNEQWTGWNPNVELVDVMTADFTGDGKADIAGRVAGTGDWWVAASTGTGFTNAKWTRWNPNLELVDVMTADFTGDGKADIAGRVAGTGGWWVAASTGTGFTNTKWTRWNPNLELVDVIAADFTGDGKADIAGRVAGTGDWWVAKSTGTGFTNAKWTRWNPNLELVDVMAADFTGDGKADIAGRIAGNGDWWVAESTGTGFANTKWTRWSRNLEWTPVLVGNFTGSGRADLIGCNAANGDWWIAKNSGSNSFVNEWWGRSSEPAGWNYLAFSGNRPSAVSLSAGATLAGWSPALLEAIAHWITLDSSGESLGLGRNDSYGITAPQAIVPDWASAPSGTAALGRLDVLSVVLDELNYLPSHDSADNEPAQPAWSVRADWLFGSEDHGSQSPGWESLLDSRPLDTADLDAFYATLE